MKRIVVLIALLSVLWPGAAQTFIRSLPTSTNLTSATKVPVDDATFGTRAVTLQNLLASTATNATLLAAITNVVEDTATSLLANKLNTTNGTAVNLTGSLTNVSVKGTLTYDLSDESRLTANLDYGIALDVGLSSTAAKARIRSVSSLADLVAIDPLTSDIFSYVKVLGYSSAGDGGGGDFRRVLASSGSTNLGTFFASTANPTYAWQRVVDNPVVNAKWFGAKGDTSTDDTAALDAARDWVQNSARTSGVSTILYLPRGNYLHSGNFTLDDQVRLKGDGLETGGAGNGTSIVCTGDNTPAVVVTGQNVQMEDIEIRYQTFQNSTKTNSAGIKFDGEIYKYVLRNVAVRRAYDALYAAQAVNVYNGTIDNLFIRSFSHSGLRMLSGGTVNVWNNVYIQNLSDATVLDSAAITNVSLANGTNITFTCSGSLPALLTTNRQFLVSGLDSAYNTKYFVRAISGSNIYCDASSTRSAPVDVTGTATFFAQPATGYPIELGNGQHVFVGLDVEHIVTDADSIIYAPSYNYVRIVDVQLEALYRSTGGLYMVNSPNGDVAVGSLHMNNLGFNVGSTNYILRTGASTSALIVGNLTARDIASSGAEWYVGSAASGADYPMIASRKEPQTFRANANGTPTGDGNLRTVLGGGPTTMTIDANSGSVDVFGAAKFSGSFLLTNNAPVITAVATNGTSGLRLNVFGGGANMIRFQTNSSTTHTFGSDGSISATSATIPTITAATALNVSGSATFSGATEISSSTPVLTARAGNGISGLRIDVTGADANNLVRFQTNGTTTHTFKPNGDVRLNAIEVGHDSDTTLARSAAGVITVEGNKVPSPASPSTGQILVFTNSNWAAMTPASSGLSVPSWEYVAHFMQRIDGGTQYQDVTWPNGGGSGGGSSLGTVADMGGHPGIVRLNNGAAGSYGYITTHLDAILFSYGAYECEFDLYLTALSNATDDYTLRIGFLDSLNGAPTDGAWVSYNHGANSGKFLANTANNSTTSTSDTGVTVAATTWYRVKVAVNAAGSTVTYTIMNNSGTSLGSTTLSANIPTARTTGNGVTMVKAAGAGAVYTYIDWARLKLEPTP